MSYDYQNLKAFTEPKKAKKIITKKRKLNLTDFAFKSAQHDALKRFKNIRKKIMSVANIDSPVVSKYLEKDIFYIIGKKGICKL